MPYAILRFQKRKAGSVASCERHNERKKEAYKSNPDIDTERSKDNYHLVPPPRYTYKKEINRMVKEAGCKVRRDSVMMVETLITASPEFMNSLPPEEQKEYGVRGQKPLALFFRRRKNIMAYRVKTYALREKATENGTRYFISFKDGQGGYHELEVSEQFFIEFRQMERRNRNLLQSDERHKEFFELSDEALNRRARVTPKGVDELIIEQERSELLRRTIAALPEIQRRRFLLYYEYDFNYYEIAAMEHCTASSVGKSISIAKEKIREQMKKYLCP